QVENDFSVPADAEAKVDNSTVPSEVEAKADTASDPVEAEAKVDNSTVPSAVEAKADTASDPVEVEAQASAPLVQEMAKTESDFAVAVTPEVVATPDQNNLAAQVQSDLDSIGRKKKKRKFKKQLDIPVEEQRAAASIPSEAKKELASADMSSLLERNLFWFALAIVGGVISVFFTVRRNRKSTDTNP
ncbi:MAG: hypothetical protein ACKN9V_08885, partial [Pseudomonadota bacterium]